MRNYLPVRYGMKFFKFAPGAKNGSSSSAVMSNYMGEEALASLPRWVRGTKDPVCNGSDKKWYNSLKAWQ